MEEVSGRKLKTINTTIEVLRGLEALDGAGVTELAEHVDLSKGAIHNHLTTLRSNRLVVKNGDEYRLALRFVTLGEYVRNKNILYQAGREEIEKLATETGEYAHLMVEEYGRGIHLYKYRGQNAVGAPYHTQNLQEPDHLHYSAAGKAILACLSDSRVRSIIDEFGLPARTDETITTEKTLFEELDTIDNRGYAFNDEEEIEGLRAVGAPVHASQGDVIGGISVSGPLSRIQDDRFREELPDLVVEAANIIELNIDTAQQ